MPAPRSLALLLVLFGFMAPPAAATTADPETVGAALARVAPLRPLRLAEPLSLPLADAYGRAAAGEIVTGLVEGDPGQPHHAWAVAVLDAPLEAVWAAANDELGFAEAAWGGQGAVVRGEACADGRASLVTMPVPLLADRWWVVSYRWGSALAAASGGTVRELSWREEAAPVSGGAGLDAVLADGVQVRVSRGAWLLVALGPERTLVEYQLQSDAGGGLPGSLAGPFCSAAIHRTLRAMEALARDGAARCALAPPHLALEAP